MPTHDTQKVDAIVNAPRPKNVQELRSFLGLAKYYGKFNQNLAEINHPLNSLLRTLSGGGRSQECERSFQELKHKLGSTEVLVHYDAKLPLKLACFIIRSRSGDITRVARRFRETSGIRLEDYDSE